MVVEEVAEVVVVAVEAVGDEEEVATITAMEVNGKTIDGNVTLLPRVVEVFQRPLN